MTKKLNAPGSKFHGQDLAEIKKEQLDEMTPEHQRAISRVEARKQFTGVAEEFAQSKIFYRNYKYDVVHKIFPGELDYDKRMVDKCYPYAKKGMLLVDEPRTEKKLKEALEKQPLLKKAGFRYVIVRDDVEISDEDAKKGVKRILTTAYDLAEQLGEL